MPSSIVVRVQGVWIANSRVDKYKLLLSKVRRQLEDAKHPFRKLQTHFDRYVSETYGTEGPVPNPNLDPDPNAALERLLRDVNEIIEVLCYVVIYFYNLKLRLEKGNADLFLVPITDLIIRGNTYQILLDFYREQLGDSLDTFRAQLQAFRKIRLTDLKISEYFTFNTSVRDKHTLKSNKQRQPVDVEDLREAKGLEQPPRPPFLKSIKEVLKTEQYAAPNKKLSQLSRVGKRMLQEIDEFWANHEIKQEHLIMDPDSWLSLFIYIIVKSERAELILDCKLMELFITDADRKSAKGHLLATLSIAIEWIKTSNAATYSRVSSSGECRRTASICV